MGLPQQTEAQQQQQNSSEGSASLMQQPSKPSPSATQLPPEALDLATKLFDFARTGQTAYLSQYLSAGIPVNLTNHKGDTLLMLAAYHGHLDTARMLVEKGADLDILNDRGQSIVAGAVFKGFDDVVKLLAESGADLAAGQPNAIEAARMFHREEMLKLFGVEE